MSGKHLSWLAVAVIVVIGAVLLFVPGKTGRDELPETRVYIPSLAEGVNEVTRLEVRGAGDRVVATLEAAESGWTVAELASYPADWAKLREVLAALARAEVIEPKTDNPAYYDRLGVEDIEAEDAAGLLLTIDLAGDAVRVILGDEAANRGGRYLRLVGEARSVLADFEADVPDDALGWVDENVVDIAPAEVAEVTLTHADGETIRVHKISADDTDFRLEPLPEGRELASSWAVNGLGGVLSGVVLDDVRPAAEFDWTGALDVTAVTFGGLSVRAWLARVDGTAWLKLEASAPFANGSAGNTVDLDTDVEPGAAPLADTAELAVTGMDAPVDAADAVDEPSGDVDAGEAPEGTGAAERAAEINARVAGWAYALPAYKAEAMDKRLEDLLKPLDDGQDES